MPQPNIIEIFSSCGHASEKKAVALGALFLIVIKSIYLTAMNRMFSFLIGLEFITLWPNC